MHTLTHMLAYLLTSMPSLCWSPSLLVTKSDSSECWDSGVLSFGGAWVLAIDRGIRKCFIPWTLAQLKLSSLPQAWSMLEPGAWLVEWHSVFAWNHNKICTWFSANIDWGPTESSQNSIKVGCCIADNGNFSSETHKGLSWAIIDERLHGGETAHP